MLAGAAIKPAAPAAEAPKPAGLAMQAGAFSQHADADRRRGDRTVPALRLDQIVEQLAPYVKLGYKHLIAGFSTPHDEESLIRFAEEVKPQLEKI